MFEILVVVGLLGTLYCVAMSLGDTRKQLTEMRRTYLRKKGEYRGQAYDLLSIKGGPWYAVSEDPETHQVRFDGLAEVKYPDLLQKLANADEDAVHVFRRGWWLKPDDDPKPVLTVGVRFGPLLLGKIIS